MNRRLSRTALAVLLSLPLMAAAADAERQAQVARLGADVMPFSLKATTHIFTKTPDGGVQRVVARSANDLEQVQRVRAHLHEIQAQFLQGDFSGPAHIHGAQMPGLAQLKAAQPNQVAIDYRDVDGGAELAFRTADPTLVNAIHQWFDAQLADHGADAMAGDMHMQHMQHMQHMEHMQHMHEHDPEGTVKP